MDLLVLAHMLFAATWFGGHIVALSLAVSLRSETDIDSLRSVAARMERMAGPVFGSSAIGVLVTGSILIWRGPYELATAWVVGGLGLLVVGMMMGGLLDSACAKQTLAACDAGDMPAAQRSASRWIRVLVGMQVVIGAAFALMVLKPTF